VKVPCNGEDALPAMPPPANTNPPTCEPSVRHLVQQSANYGMSERGRVGCFLIMGPEAAARGERQYNSLACKRSHFIALGWDLHSRVDRSGISPVWRREAEVQKKEVWLEVWFPGSLQ
jgi:hypothetical protein